MSKLDTLREIVVNRDATDDQVRRAVGKIEDLYDLHGFPPDLKREVSNDLADALYRFPDDNVISRFREKLGG